MSPIQRQDYLFPQPASMVLQDPVQADLVLLCFSDTVLFTNKVCGNPAWSKSTSAIFPTAFAYFVSLCHILVILAMFQSLHQQKNYKTLKVQMMVSIF